jgi:hypothetical protein
VFSADQTGPFYELLPNHTLEERRNKDNLQGDKNGKKRMTLHFLTSMAGEKRTPFSISSFFFFFFFF